MATFWTIAVKVAGLGAVCALVFLLIYKGILALPIFSTLKKDHQYKLLTRIVTLTFSFAITGLVAYVFVEMNGRAPRNVTYEVRLQHGDVVLDTDFEAIFIDSGIRKKVEGQNGRAIVSLPDSLASIDTIQVRTPCYAQSDSGPFRLIEEEPIEIEMRKIRTQPPDPLPPFAYPNPENVIPSTVWPPEATFATEEEDPESHVLEIHNRSGESLYLMLFNYRRYKEGSEPWRVLHSGECDETTYFSNFAEASGLFGLILLEEDNIGHPRFTQNLDVYAKERTKLVIEKSDNGYIVNTE